MFLLQVGEKPISFFVRLILVIGLDREALVFQINRFVIGNRIKLGGRNSLRDAITKKHRNTAWKIEVRSNNGCIAAWIC